MKRNSDSVEFDQLEKSRKKYQRRLIPANIVVIIIAVIAALCQIIMPMIKVDVAITGDTFAAVAEMSGQTDGGADGETGGEGQNEDMAEVLGYVLQDVSAQVTVQIMPLSALELGVDPDAQTVRDYITRNAGDLTAAVDDILEQAMPRFIAYIVASAAQAQSEEYADLPVDEITAVTDLIGEGKYEEAKAQFPAAAQTFAQEMGYTLDGQTLDELSDMFGQMVDAGINEDNTFSYTQAIASLGGEGGEGETGGAMPDIGGMLDSALAEMPDEQARTVGMALFAVTAVFIGLTSALWLLMALIAFFRIFLKNKRFTMWYVKLTAWLPGTLFVLAPATTLPKINNACGAVCAARLRIRLDLPTTLFSVAQNRHLSVIQFGISAFVSAYPPAGGQAAIVFDYQYAAVSGCVQRVHLFLPGREQKNFVLCVAAQPVFCQIRKRVGLRAALPDYVKFVGNIFQRLLKGNSFCAIKLCQVCAHVCYCIA